MAEAKIALSLSPREFDLAREVLKREAQRLNDLARHSEAAKGAIEDATKRREWRAQAAEIELLLERLV